MKRIVKSSLAFLLAFMMVFGAAPLSGFVGLDVHWPGWLSFDWLSIKASAYTEGIYTYTVSSDKATITDCSGSASGTITIPDTLGGYMVVSLGGYAFSNCSLITEITIPDSVTSIGDAAFWICSSLTSITIPDSVTSIGSNAFFKCTSLTNITIPNSVTSIGRWAFEYCTSLTNITIPNSVTSIEDYAFHDCYSLTSITIPNSVTSIEDYAFAGCTGLTSITIPNSVTSIGSNAFAGCTGLTSITIPNNVTSIEDYAFHDCYSLTSATIGNSVTSIGNYAFVGCTGLTSITIPNSVKSIGDRAFDICSKLLNIFVNSGNATYSSINGVLINKNQKELIKYPDSKSGGYTIPNSVASIGDYAFHGCTSLTSIIIPNSVTSFGDYTFSSCRSLTSITIPNNVTSIGNFVFDSCTGLTSITIPNSVPTIGSYTFYKCSGLTCVTIGNSVTSIGNYAFAGCTGLTSITIPNNVTSIGDYAFSSCRSLTSITIPNNVTRIGWQAFNWYNINLTIYCIQDSVAHIYAMNNSIKYYLLSNIFTSKANSTYDFKIVDADSSLPVAGANAAFNSGNYVSFPDGSVIFFVGALPTGENRKITITKNGYNSKTIYLDNLDPYAQTVVRLEPNNSITNMIPDISTGSDTVTGPTINFAGMSFPLFSFEVGCDLPLPGVKFINNPQDKTYKIIAGVKESTPVNDDTYNKLKNYFYSTPSKNLPDSMKNFLAKSKPKFGVDCSGSVAFFAEFDYSTGQMVLKEGGLMILLEASVSLSAPFPAPFSFAYWKFSLGGSIGASIGLTFQESGVVGINGTVEAKLKPSVGVGLGCEKIAGVEIGLKGTVGAKYIFDTTIANPTLEDMFELYLEAQFYAKAYALFFEAEYKTSWPKLELFPEPGFSKAAAISINKYDMQMMPRDYLNTQTKQAKTMATTVASIDKQSVYPYGAPKLTTLSNGNILAVWVDDNGTKTDANRTTLFYSVYDGSSWTTPAAVCQSPYADFSAEVCTYSNKVGVLWQRGTEVFTEDVALDHMLAHTDLMFTAFDGTAFSAPVAVGTPNDGKYETAYNIASDGSDLTVVWLENSANDYSLSTGTNTVYAQTLSGGTWQSVETVNANVPGISSLAVGHIGNSRDIAWCADTDGNLSTMGDTELFVNGTQITYNTVDDLNIKFESGSFWYKSNGQLVKLNEGYSATDTGLAFDGNYNIVSNGATTAAVFTQSSDFANEAMVAYQNAGGTFTTPVSLYSNGTLVNAFSAVMKADGSITMAMNAKNLSADPEAASPYTTTDFLVKDFGDTFDLAIGDVLSSDRTAVVPGGDVELAATVKNNSTAAIDGYTLTLTDASGSCLTDKTIYEPLASGAQADVSITYTLPTNLVGHEVKLTATPLADVIETDTANNTVKTQIGLGDLSVSSQIEPNSGGALITTTVTNSGYTAVTAGSLTVKQLAETTELLNTQTIGSLAPGQSAVRTYQVSADRLIFDSEYNGKTFVAEVTTDQEENDYANNDATVTLSPVRAASLSISHETLTLAVDETFGLTAAVAPSNAFNKSVYFISDSTDVATVDDTGNITAVGTGTAIITAISSDGGIVKACAVTVQSNKLTAGENGTLVMNTSTGFITGIDMNASSVADLRLQIANTNIQFLDKDGNSLPGENLVGTGCVVQLINNAGAVLDAKTIVIFGDINGEGSVSVIDALMALQASSGLITLNDVQNFAGNVNNDTDLTVIDALKILQYSSGIITAL